MDYANIINGIPSGFESNIEIPKSLTNGVGIGYDSDTVKKKLENVKNVTEAMSTLLESRKKAIGIARDLRYDEKFINQLKTAKSEDDINRIMISARHDRDYRGWL